MPKPSANTAARNSTDKASLAERKAQLETRIEQQRIDVLVNAEHWRQATHGIDALYHAVMRWKAPLYGAAGLIAWRSLRRPKGVRRLAGRALGLALTARRLRRLVK
jgi:hypothetical protein